MYFFIKYKLFCQTKSGNFVFWVGIGHFKIKVKYP